MWHVWREGIGCCGKEGASGFSFLLLLAPSGQMPGLQGSVVENLDSQLLVQEDLDNLQREESGTGIVGHVEAK